MVKTIIVIKTDHIYLKFPDSSRKIWSYNFLILSLIIIKSMAKNLNFGRSDG